MRTLLLLITLLLCFLAPHPTHAQSRFVFTVTSADDTTDGTCDAHCTLREAITRANTIAGADEIVIDLPDNTTITLVSTLPAIGEEVIIRSVDPSRSITISGDDQFRVFSVEADRSLTLRDLTITNGLSNGTGALANGGNIYSLGDVTLDGGGVLNGRAAEKGAGIYIENGTLTMQNSAFVTSNEILPPIVTLSDRGGGIYALNATVAITETAFSQNAAVGGGAIYLDGSVATIVQAIFSQNVAQTSNSGSGGAIQANSTSQLMVDGALFADNSSSSGGAINTNATTTTISDSYFQGNTASNGGALYHGFGDLMVASSMFFENDANLQGGAIYKSRNSDETTVDASALVGSEAELGGGIYKQGGHLTIRNSTISSNTLVDAAVSGATVLRGGGVFGRCHNNQTPTTCTTTIEHTTIAANSAQSGGGVYFVDGTGTNEAQDNVSITHTLIGDNTSDDCVNGSNVVLNSYNHIESGQCTAGGNNIGIGDANLGPIDFNGGTVYVVPALFPNDIFFYASHALLSGSQAIDAGDPNIASPSAFDTRGDGFPRIQNNHIDIGAFEFAPTCWATPNNGTNVFAGDTAGVVREAILLAGADGHVKVAGYCRGVSGSSVVSIANDLTLTGGYTLTTFTASDWASSDPLNNPTTLDAEGNGRVIDIGGGGVTLADLRLTGGNTTGSGGGILQQSGSLTGTGLWVYGNSASEGAGVYSEGTLTLKQSAVTGNTGSADGGGLYIIGTATLANTTISDNDTSGSATTYGAGLYNEGSTTLHNVTIAKNGSDQNHVGLFNDGAVTIKNTLIVDNVTAVGQCSGVGASDASSDSIADDGSCGGAANVAFNLPALAFNGGATPNHLPNGFQGSVGNGDDAICNGATVGGVDQRGFTRASCDTGAVEVSAAPTVVRVSEQAAGAVAVNSEQWTIWMIASFVGLVLATLALVPLLVRKQ